MLILKEGLHSGLMVKPRWPSTKISIENITFIQLISAQEKLPEHTTLLISRAYEPKNSPLGLSRKIFRWVGIKLFNLFYPSRKSEVTDIFSSNGHDVDGTHVDVSILINEKRVRLLPLGVFTPLFWQKYKVKKYSFIVSTVNKSLFDSGFIIHRNNTESLQIHCDLKMQEIDFKTNE
jgi:hypothetical protein